MQRITRQIWIPLAGIALLLQFGCASTKILVPPRVDLTSYGTLGILEFTTNGDSALGPLSTQTFLQTMQSAQPQTRVLELGPQNRVLNTIGRHSLDLDAIKAIGKEYGVDAVVTGNLDVTSVKPGLSAAGSLTSISLKAEVNGHLTAKILETKSGATLWTSGARGNREVAKASLSSGGPFSIGASSPEKAYGSLVRGLVYESTHDFRAHWERE